MYYLIYLWVIAILGIASVIYIIKYEGKIMPIHAKALLGSFLLTVGGWFGILFLTLYGLISL